MAAFHLIIYGRFCVITEVQGKIPAVLAEQRKLAALTHDPDLLEDDRAEANAYANAGLPAARFTAVQLKEKRYSSAVRMHDGYSAFAISLQYALIGNREKTLAWLRRSMMDSTKDFTEDFLSAPELDSLRSDPRLRAIQAAFLTPIHRDRNPEMSAAF